MGRPPVFSPETKTRIVLSVLSGEISVAEAARKEKIREQSIGRWKAEFLEAGKTALAAGKSGLSTREAQLEARAEDLTVALGKAAVDLWFSLNRGGFLYVASWSGAVVFL